MSVTLQREPQAKPQTELQAITEEQRADGKRPRGVMWYRTKIDPEELKSLHVRSDLLGGLQTFGFLGLLILTGALALYSAWHWPWWVTVLLVFLHGTLSSSPTMRCMNWGTARSSKRGG